MKNLLKSVFAAAMLLLMVACNGSKTNEAYPLPMKYLPVQLEGSKMWSILDLESGDVVVKDVYKAMPSAVVNDMYFVMNDEGTFDYYNVADPKKPVNKEHFGSATEFGVEGLALASLKGKPISIINEKCEVVKELMMQHFNERTLVEELSRIVYSERYREKMLRNYDEVIRRMGEPGASGRFARMMVEALR